MNIISWNVNGIRAVARKGFKDFVYEYDPDILCIQETKAFESQFLKEVGNLEGYNYVWHVGERPGYSGTAIFYKENLQPVDSKNHFGEIEHFHTDGRITEVEFNDFVIINGYFPNGGTKSDGTEMLSYKLEFYDHLIHYANSIVNSGKNVIITGDFNICHTENDIARPEQNKNSIGFSPQERDKVSELLDNGYVDVFREFYPDAKDVYSWWSYRGGARQRNVGWRIDYFITNKGFIDKLKDIQYLMDVKGSDHCPLKLELK